MHTLFIYDYIYSYTEGILMKTYVQYFLIMNRYMHILNSFV